MRFAAPGTVRYYDHPPVATDITLLPGAASRISAQQRHRIVPRLWPERFCTGFDPKHPYVLTYWIAALGAGPITDLLRLVTAAKRQTEIAHPVYLSVLCQEGLAHFVENAVWVRPLVPPLDDRQLNRLSPRLRLQHRQDSLSTQQASAPVPLRKGPEAGT